MFICQHAVAVKRVLVTACLDKRVVRAKGAVNHLVKEDVNQAAKPVAKQVVKVVANQNQKQIEDQIILVH